MPFGGWPCGSLKTWPSCARSPQIGSPAKNELANLLVNEKSTVFERIKRLVRDDLLEEQLDVVDRRIRRVRLTTAGKQAMEAAETRSDLIGRVLLGPLTEEQRSSFLACLQHLERHHAAQYQHHATALDPDAK